MVSTLPIDRLAQLPKITKWHPNTMRPLSKTAALTTYYSGLGLDVETNSPTPVEGVELSADTPFIELTMSF